MHRLPIGRTILLLILATSFWWWWSNRPLRHEPGVLVAQPPQQVDEPPHALPEHDGFKLNAIAKYHLRARVLGTKRYYGGIQSGLVPVDVAVGWGSMSDQSVLDQLSLSMSNRFFFYQWQNQPPVPKDVIMRSAANNHVISADGKVSSTVKGLRRGQIVDMSGWLVEATGPEGFRWKSSLRRDDTGNGACELFYVDKINVWDSPPDNGVAVGASASTR